MGERYDREAILADIKTEIFSPATLETLAEQLGMFRRQVQIAESAAPNKKKKRKDERTGSLF